MPAWLLKGGSGGCDFLKAYLRGIHIQDMGRGWCLCWNSWVSVSFVLHMILLCIWWIF